MTFDEYLAIDAEHWSCLREMRRSAKHYLYRRENALPDTASLREGRAGHTAVLEPDRFMYDYALFTGKTRRGKEWDACVAENVGKTILKTPEYRRALAIRDAVHAHPVAAKHLVAGEPEKSIQWTDAETGLPCKARIDWLGVGYLIDLKTTGVLDAHQFAQVAARLGYHCQLAFYRRGMRALGMHPEVRIIAAESKPPHDVATFLFPEDAITAGDDECTDLLRKVADCRERDVWPGRFPEETTLALPGWAFTGLFDDAADDSLGLVVEGAEV